MTHSIFILPISNILVEYVFKIELHLRRLDVLCELKNLVISPTVGSP